MIYEIILPDRLTLSTGIKINLLSENKKDKNGNPIFYQAELPTQILNGKAEQLLHIIESWAYVLKQKIEEDQIINGEKQ